MPEIELRKGGWLSGIPIDATTVHRDLYLLLAIFAASAQICGRRSGENDEGSVYGYSVRYFELFEIGKILVSIAVICRNDWDFRTMAIEDLLEMCGQGPNVGQLTPDLTRADVVTDLHVRESWNKIVHCHTMNFHRSDGTSAFSGHLEPLIHLYGEHRGKDWKATIDVYRWCEVVHSLT